VPRQVDAKERKPRIRNRINERPNELIPTQPQIRPAKRNDPRIRGPAIQDGKPIRREASSKKHPIRSEQRAGIPSERYLSSWWRFGRAGVMFDRRYFAAGHHFAARCLYVGA
jgi:hypothetical protein